MYDLRVIVAVVVLHQLDIRTCTAQIVHQLYCDDAVITFIRNLPDEGDHSIIETLQRCNKVCELFEQCMSEYRAGVHLSSYWALNIIHTEC